MEEGKNEIMELRQMIEGCFERQNNRNYQRHKNE